MKSILEDLESRLQFSVAITTLDGGDTFASAADLGRIAGTLVVNNKLLGDESSDFIRFNVRFRGNVNINLSDLSANANLRLLDVDGNLIASSARPRTGGESISTELKRGTYTLAVDRGKLAPDTPYKLSVQADLNFGTVDIDGHVFSVSLNRADGNHAAILDDRETWVVIHGWQSTPAIVHPLAEAIDEASTRNQVLELDWSAAAADANVVAVALRVADVGAFVAAKLADWGIPGSLINLAGHSFGGYMTDEIARRVAGGVDRVVALDPATPTVGGFDLSNTDFAAHSNYSIAFLGSDFGNLAASDTADEAINLDVGKRSRLGTHLNVLDLFTSMTAQNNGRRHDAISPLFSLKAIRSSAARGFLPGGLGHGYEAALVGRASGDTWVPRTLTYKDETTTQTIELDA